MENLVNFCKQTPLFIEERFKNQNQKKEKTQLVMAAASVEEKKHHFVYYVLGDEDKAKEFKKNFDKYIGNSKNKLHLVSKIKETYEKPAYRFLIVTDNFIEHWPTISGISWVKDMIGKDNVVPILYPTMENVPTVLRSPVVKSIKFKPDDDLLYTQVLKEMLRKEVKHNGPSIVPNEKMFSCDEENGAKAEWSKLQEFCVVL